MADKKETMLNMVQSRLHELVEATSEELAKQLGAQPLGAVERPRKEQVEDFNALTLEDMMALTQEFGAPDVDKYIRDMMAR